MCHLRLLLTAFTISTASLLTMSAGAATTKPLAEAAATLTKNLPQGAIVTAERIRDKVSYASTGRLEPADTPPERAIFEIGSITKVFTGILLADAVLEKKVTFDTTLREVMGREQTFADSRVGAITLKQLATHTSGLPRIPDDLFVGAAPGDPYAHYDRARMNAFIGKVKLLGEPPFESGYSNLGVGLLGDVLSRVHGKTWDKLIAEKITGPLGMKDTVMTLSEEQQKRLVPPYEGAKQVKSWTFQSFAGCGSLRSTAADMMLFGEAILHHGKSPLKDLLTLVMQPQTPQGDIGLCLMLSKFDDQRELHHNGGTGGYRSALQVLPDSGTVRVVLVNNGKLEADRVLAAVRDEKPRAKESDKILTAAQLADYEGVYAAGPNARFTILRRGDQLWTQLTGQGFLRLYPHEQEDRFFLKTVAAEVQFHRENGKITSLTNHQNGRELPAKKTEAPVPQIKFRNAKELAAFAGTYELTPGMIFKVKAADEVLFVQLTGQPFAPVFEKKDNWFEYDVVDAALEFEHDKDGKVTALKLHQNGAVMRAAKKG